MFQRSCDNIINIICFASIWMRCAGIFWYLGEREKAFTTTQTILFNHFKQVSAFLRVTKCLAFVVRKLHTVVPFTILCDATLS